jgi:peptide/nickel transport system ATP-binding protein
MESIGLWLDLDLKAAYERALQVLREVQLPDPELIFNKYPHELSGGQRQRAMIAMAMVVDPKVLIADEPTTALDVTVQKEILELLKSLQKKRNMALLLITHDMGVVKQLADEVLVLYAGQGIESGPRDAVLFHPRHPYTQALIEASFLEVDEAGRLTPIKGSVPHLGEEPSGCRFHPRCPYAFDACKQVPPPFFTRGDTQVRCLLYAEEGDPLQTEFARWSVKEKYQTAPPESSRSEPILKVEKLSKRYPIYQGILRTAKGGVDAVKEASFEVYPNEIVGIVGESGSGKTTLGKMIAGLVTPTSGSITVNKPPQMIFQDPGAAMNPRHTVGEALIEPLLYHKLAINRQEAEAKVVELLEKIGFDHSIFHRYPHEFSLGQKQRLATARSLLLGPELIICDEPVSALDVSVQAQILNLFLDLKNTYLNSYLFISHDLAVVKFIASRVIVMEKGVVVEQGDVKTIFEKPAHPYTQKLINGCSLL